MNQTNQTNKQMIDWLIGKAEMRQVNQPANETYNFNIQSTNKQYKIQKALN